MQWLYKAEKKYGLIILNYMVTSNHVHLSVYDHAGDDAVPESIQLSAGKTGQEHNHRKKRAGAFRQDRYHATAVGTGEHLQKCIVYIDLNMVRTGTVNHPSRWLWCGYNEIQKPGRKNILIDYEKLRELAGFDSFDIFQAAHGTWVDYSLANCESKRESQWTESIASSLSRPSDLKFFSGNLIKKLFIFTRCNIPCISFCCLPGLRSKLFPFFNIF